MLKGQMVYIATPYSDPDKAVRERRFKNVTRYASELMDNGVLVYSPITHSHPMTEFNALPGDWAFWKDLDTKMIGCCDILTVYMQPGWESSSGVQAEIKIAESLGVPVTYVDPLDVWRGLES